LSLFLFFSSPLLEDMKTGDYFTPQASIRTEEFWSA
jgi:hypothetical protein